MKGVHRGLTPPMCVSAAGKKASDLFRDTAISAGADGEGYCGRGAKGADCQGETGKMGFFFEKTLFKLVSGETTRTTSLFNLPLLWHIP